MQMSFWWLWFPFFNIFCSLSSSLLLFYCYLIKRKWRNDNEKLQSMFPPKTRQWPVTPIASPRRKKTNACLKPLFGTSHHHHRFAYQSVKWRLIWMMESIKYSCYHQVMRSYLLEAWTIQKNNQILMLWNLFRSGEGK